jgi:hypothetical protein
MDRIGSLVSGLHSNEEGHALPAVGALIAGIGIVLLGFGAANANDALCIAGGFIGGLGVIAAALLNHRGVDYELYDRIGKLENK